MEMSQFNLISAYFLLVLNWIWLLDGTRPHELDGGKKVLSFKIHFHMSFYWKH